jgi:mRNA interferase RelE/StbE
MSYQVLLSEDAKRALLKLDKAISSRLVKKLESAKEDPLPYLKRLEGVPLFSLRAGDYRLIISMDFEKNTMLVIRVGHRKKVYDGL